MKVCFVCKKELPLSEFKIYYGRYFSYCNECNKKKCREWREKNRERSRSMARERARKIVKEEGEKFYERNRQYARELYKKNGYKKRPVDLLKTRAVNRVRKAVNSGKLIRPKECSLCGRVGYITGHHHDYTKPLDVRWLCVPCHKKNTFRSY